MEAAQLQQQQQQLHQKMLQYMSTFKRQNPQDVVDKIRAGDDFATQAVNLLQSTSSDVAFRTKLCQAGLLDVLLDFLDECNTGKSLQEVLSSSLPLSSQTQGRGGQSGSSGTGSLAFAHIWTNCLMNCLTDNAMRPESRLEEYRIHVAKRLVSGHALAECMCNSSTAKLFFNSRQEYLQNMMFFTGLIANLVLSPATIPILVECNNDEMDDMIRAWCVQALFMPMYRPDIVAETVELTRRNMIMPGHFPKLQTIACNALQEFCDAVPRHTTACAQTGRFIPTVAGKILLRCLGNLPAVHPLYYHEQAAAAAAGQGHDDHRGGGGVGRNNVSNNNSMMTMTFATGLLDVIKSSHEALSMDHGRGYDSLFYCWGQLLYAFCPEKGELGESASQILVALGLGARAMTYPTFAQALLESIHCYAIRPSSPQLGVESVVYMPHDVVIGSLISEGFGEMLLRLVVKHHTNSPLVTIVEHHLDAVGCVALASKTNKALIKRKASLSKELDRVKGQAAATKRHVAKCIQTMDSILEKATIIGGAAQTMGSDTTVAATAVGFCRWCQKQVPASDLKQCAKCHRSSYCSKLCQTKDWKEGRHRQLCKLMMTNSARAEASGASKKEIRSERKHEANLSKAGNLLFDKRTEHILLQACLLGYDITNCVTLMDFRDTPATITVMTIPQYLADQCDPNDIINRPHDAAQYAYNKGICERNQANAAVTVACVTTAADGSGEALLKTIFANGLPWRVQQLGVGYRNQDKIQNLGTAAKNAMIEQLVQQQYSDF